MIPIQTGDEVTGVSLKIVRGKEKKGLVDILFDSPLLGKVTASFAANSNGISGTIAVQNEETAGRFREMLDRLSEELTEGNETAELSVVSSRDLTLAHFETVSRQREQRMADTADASEATGPEAPAQDEVATRRLYRIAERFLSGVTAAAGENGYE